MEETFGVLFRDRKRQGQKRRRKEEDEEGNWGETHIEGGGEAGKGPRVKGAKGKKDKDWLEIFCNVEKI